MTVIKQPAAEDIALFRDLDASFRDLPDIAHIRACANVIAKELSSPYRCPQKQNQASALITYSPS